jgi:hypothetical protein
LWYLKGRGDIERADSGRYTITVQGFDAVEQAGQVANPVQRQITEPKNES